MLQIASGDTLLVAPGDLLAVDALLEDERASFSLDWINGECSPRTYRAGDIVPAGAFAAGQAACTLAARTPFSESPLRELLRTPERLSNDGARSSHWWQRLARLYVIGVLAVATAGFVGWLTATGDLGRALRVTTAVLIVTCPCAFGIAAPLAYELVQAGLRRRGLFVRRAAFLDRARAIKRVVFDKTGTLTTGSPSVVDADVLSALGPTARSALYIPPPGAPTPRARRFGRRSRPTPSRSIQVPA